MRPGRAWIGKGVRGLLWALGGGFVLFSLSVAVFHAGCKSSQPGFAPVTAAISGELRSAEKEVGAYAKPEEGTYLTYPEWYLVFNPQEYGRFLDKERPSGFPYFGSIRQFWSGYCEVCGIANRHYPFNAGKHLMVVVIGVSFTVEYAIKGAYENTIGRMSEWTRSGERTSEEAYAAEVAKEYGAFVPTDPWFQFPFGEKFTGLWRENSLWGPDFIRKSERKFILSLEYGLKAGYAWAIGLGSHAAYGIADTEVFAAVKNASEDIFLDPRIRKLKDVGMGAYLIAVPHYQGFTDVVPGLAGKGVDFIDVAGNDEILMTALVPADREFALSAGKILFTVPVLSEPDTDRIAIQAPVASLRALLLGLQDGGAKIEHLFDY